MHRRIALVLMVSILALSVSGCGKDSAEPQTSTTVAESTEQPDLPAGDNDLALPVTSTRQADSVTQSEDGEQPPDSSESVVQGFGPLFQKYVRERVQSGTYTVRFSQSGMRMTTYISGKNSVIDSDTAGILHFLLINKDGHYYMVMPGTKKYAEMTAEDYQKQANVMAETPLKTEGMVLKNQGEETLEGKKYSTETYTESGGRQVTYYFDDTGLRRAKVKSDGKISNIESFEVITGVDASAFEVPAGYTLVTDPGQLFA